MGLRYGEIQGLLWGNYRDGEMYISRPIWNGRTTEPKARKGRGLGSNLYRLGVPEMVIQRILRYANVSTTATFCIKTAADDVREGMTVLENRIGEPSKSLSVASGTLDGNAGTPRVTIQ
jgi:hypothetical protein